MKQPWIYDIEQLKNCHTNTFMNTETGELKSFVIHNLRNDIEDYINFLETQVYVLIGFNNLEYDYPLLHFLLLRKKYFKKANADTINEFLYKASQDIINAKLENKFVQIRYKDEIIHQVDLYKIWHFDNKAKSTSLKALQAHMGYWNVQEMPIHYTSTIKTLDEIEQILSYNINDVKSTYEFYLITRGRTNNVVYKDKDRLQLRFDINKEYGINCLNFNDVKLGVEIVLKEYCQETYSNLYDVKKLRTYRNLINLKDLISNKIQFKTEPFKNLLHWFQSISFNPTEENEFSKDLILNGCKFMYGLGGMHQSQSGIFESSNSLIIKDLDVASLYPTTILNLGIYPAHLGKEFNEVYSKIREKRIYAKRNGQNAVNEALKLSLNGSYGKFNSNDSYLYDPIATFTTTINCQLFLSMLIEELILNIPNIIIIQTNTDGISIQFDKKYNDTLEKIKSDWENYANYELEEVEYSKMVVRDVSNYLAIKINGKVKHKGCFEIDKELHKDNSFRIVPIALEKYYKENIPIETTIKNHQNILDYCGRIKIDNRFKLQFHSIKIDKSGNSYKSIEDLQKVTRYLVTINGGTIYKKDIKGKLTGINVGYTFQIYNIHNKIKQDFNIDYLFYIRECNKIINSVYDGSLTLF